MFYFRIQLIQLNMNHFRWTLLISIFLIACNSSGIDSDVKYKLDNIHQEVMAIHDAVMPELGTINSLSKRLKNKLKNEEEVDKDKIQDLIYRLNDAEEAMMIWMGDFKKPSYKDEAAARKIYAEEKQEIMEVDRDIKAAIANAENFLNSI